MNIKHLYIFFGTGVLFFLDQLCKWIARSHPELTLYLINPWLGWEFLANPGVAFGIPIPNVILIILTPLIVILLLSWHTRTPRPLSFTFGSALVCAGALSNFIDRIALEYTTDYIRVITSVMNIADIMIVSGALFMIRAVHTKK